MAAKLKIDMDRARTLRAAGLAIEKVADEVGCSKTHLRGVFKRDGDPLPGGAMPLLRTFDHAKACEMRRSGKPLAEIAEACGASVGGLRRALVRGGLVNHRGTGVRA